MSQIPSFESLQIIAYRLKEANVTFALGGSGLLLAHGLVDVVNDWDITTDAPWAKIEPLIQDFEYQLLSSDGIFATAYRCKIQIHDATIDLMGRFAIKTKDGLFTFPTEYHGSWQGIPLGSVDAWAHAYKLMGRKSKHKLCSARRTSLD